MNEPGERSKVHTRADPYQARARELCREAGFDPDSRRYDHPTNNARGRPAWTDYRQAARGEHLAREQAELAAALAIKQKDCPYPAPQPGHYAHAPLAVVGRDHEPSTLDQMANCMKVGNVVAGAICADGHLGYAQPVGASVAVTAWCRPLISYDPRFKGLVPFECLNGGWHGKFDPAKNVIHTRDDDLAHPMPAIKVWEGETPDLGHNEAIRWIEDQIK